MKTILSLLFVLLIGSAASAQNFVFKVLANKGSNELKTTQAAWTPLKTGAMLQSGDELKVSENAYLGLMHSSGRTLEITNAGVMNVDELAKTINANSTSVTSKYADFVLNKLSADEEGSEMEATGAVKRDVQIGDFRVYMPSSVELFNGQANISWTELEMEGEPVYLVSVKNMFDEVIFNAETTSNNIDIDFDQAKFKGQRLVILNVTVQGMEDEVKSGDYGISRVNPDKADILNSELSEIKGEESSMNYVMLASFYEKNKLIVDALNAYRKAAELSPEVEDFKTLLADFMARNGLVTVE